MTNDPPQAPQNDHSAPVKVGCPAGFSSECSYWTSNDVCRCNTIEHQHAQQALIIRALRTEITHLNDQISTIKEHYQRRCDTLTNRIEQLDGRDRSPAAVARIQAGQA